MFVQFIHVGPLDLVLGPSYSTGTIGSLTGGKCFEN